MLDRDESVVLPGRPAFAGSLGGGGRAVLQKAKLVMHLSSNKVEKEFSSPLPECNSSE